ncbi:hypothetical protein EC973_002921 [Apophysomyces ossiformis]|uniref:Xylanolytic transcriptional activator regulatory domain-containing protein n=1 Tax=Apophysomyces ossiformis TaxID=679940 RepID=A0A8H7ENC4_9FUNG|nr:hypothetical protein EC973_002921 [Apophysomyces ossiformis]
MCHGCRIARERVCTFYADGSIDPDQEDHSSSSEVEDENDTSQLFRTDTMRDRRQTVFLESRTSNMLASLGEDLRKLTLTDYRLTNSTSLFDAQPFGNFIKWTAEPGLPSKYTGSIEMPSREIQLHLINSFYQNFYEILPMIPKRYFYQQLHGKGPLITPLLLNAIYAQASRFATIPNVPKSNVFFHRAKRLLDDFLDVPRLSTVAALCLMSLYETEPTNNRSGSQHCRAWIYSGMAHRMCIELGCHSEANMSRDLKPEDIELRRRIFWCCFCLDKFQSGGWERPFMIPSSIARVDYPTIPTEEHQDTEEREITINLHRGIEFLRLVEESLVLATTGPCAPDPDNVVVLYEKQCAWLQTLPSFSRWTPAPSSSIDHVMRLPVPKPGVAHLHLYFNLRFLSILCQMSGFPCTENQRVVTATCITQLVHGLLLQPAAVIKFDFLAHALIEAIKIHARHLNDRNIYVARHAWSMYDRTVTCLKHLQQYAIIPNCSKFLQQIENMDGRIIAGSMVYKLPQQTIVQQDPSQGLEKADSVSYPMSLQTSLDLSTSAINEGSQKQYQHKFQDHALSTLWPPHQPDWNRLVTKPSATTVVEYVQNCFQTHPPPPSSSSRSNLPSCQ